MVSTGPEPHTRGQGRTNAGRWPKPLATSRSGLISEAGRTTVERALLRAFFCL
jgi:hypothetical protein